MKNNIYMSLIITLIIGFIIDALYIVVGDLVIGGWLIDAMDFPGNIFFAYILLVGILGIIAIIRYCNYVKENKLLVMPIISVVAGSFMHFNCIIHDSVLYYHLHGKFMPIADDLGYFFFLVYLAVVYFLWALVSIVFPIYKNVKTKC